MIFGDRNNLSGLPESDDDLLRRNRISSIEAPEESQGPPRKKFNINLKHPAIILSGIAALLIVAILIATKYIFKTPRIFKPSEGQEGAPIEDYGSSAFLESSNERITRGKESFSRGYLTDAYSEFNEVVESDATNRDKAIALIYMARIAIEKGDSDKAREYLNRAQTYDRKNPEIYKYLSLTYRRERDYGRALESVQESISMNPDDSNSLFMLGNLYFEMGKYDDAIAQYQAITQKEPNNAKALYNMAYAMMKKGDEFAALEYFKKAGAADRIGDIAHRAYSQLGVMYTERQVYDEAEKYLKMAVSIRPNDAVNRYSLGVAYLRQNKREAALSELQRAVELGENNAKILESVGEEYLSMGEYDRSIEAFSKIKSFTTRNIRVLMKIAEVYQKKGELDKAYSAYLKITQIEPATENARLAYRNMGNVLMDMQRYDDSIDAYRKALAISPKDAMVYVNMGEAYSRAGKPELAIDAWRKAAQLDPNNPAPLQSIGNYYYEKNFYDLAEKQYEAILRRWPNDQQAHFRMATIYNKRGNTTFALDAYKRVLEIDRSNDLARLAYIEQAMLISRDKSDRKSLDQSKNMLEKALMIKPGDPEALISMGVVYSRMELWDQAIENFFQALKATPDSKLMAEAYNNIGKCYYKKGQYRDALKYFTRGIEEDPTNEEIRMNRKAVMQAYEAELDRER